MFNEHTLDALDWDALQLQLDQDGCAIIRSLLSTAECDDVSALYPKPEPFRSRVMMARHGFGRGEYKYFSYPLPDLVARLRNALYPWLVPIANRWYEQMDLPVRFPEMHQAFLEAVMPPVSNAPRRCCCNTGRRITTACIRTCTANTSSRCRWRFFCQHPSMISPAASLC